MHRLATVHARDNQPTTNDVTIQPISISASFTNGLTLAQCATPGTVVSLLQLNLACNILLILAIKRVHNLPPHLSYVSTLPDIAQKPTNYVVFFSVV